jgi:hypothetical protein
MKDFYISQNELLELANKHEPEASQSPPTFREATCVKCGAAMEQMWHLWLHDGGFKKEIHMCAHCGEDYLIDMPVNLVVVAAHGQEFLDECLDSLGDENRILVVDTHSSNKLTVPDRANIELMRMPFAGYTTGAYLWAYWNRPAVNYLFIQDSMRAKDKGYLRPFIDNLPERGVAAWAYFNFGFDDDGQRDYAHFIYSEDAEKGIFAPVFYISKTALDELSLKELLPPVPTNKNQAMASERLWPMAFKAADMPVEFVSGEWSAPKMESGEFDIFTKIFAGRP